MTLVHPISDIAADTATHLQQALNCSAIIATILVRRGIDTPEKGRVYLECPLDVLRDPMHLYGMGAAVARIVAAIHHREPILVFGDYDADGVSATCLMVEFLRDCGALVSSHIPHRITDGYGFHPDSLNDNTVPEGTRLIVTVDCGISSHDAVTAAAQRGIDVIITDHHDVGPTVPPAVAVINPKQPRCTAGVDHLAGVGVAFYLAIAVRSGLRIAGYWSARRPEPNMMAYIDLVALGTLADVVPLILENRILVRRGLQLMRAGLRPGLAALTGSGGSQNLSSDDVTFRLAPPINAAGRLRHADRALQLLLSRDPETAEESARHLLDLNARRKDLEHQILQAAATALAAAVGDPPPAAIVLADAQWHLGVLGIVASRLSSQHGCPAILFTRNGDHWKGSGRSPEGIDIMACLNRCSEGIHAYGGHSAAAGLTLTDRQMADFAARFNDAVAVQLATQCPSPPIAADLELPLSAVTPELADQLLTLEPFGSGNPEPVFLSRHVTIVSVKAMGGSHCRLIVAPRGRDTAPRLSAVYFNAPWTPSSGDTLDTLSYHIRWNYWNGRRTLQLLVVSICDRA
ncbi:MAG: single-stranded-DNA-specific exonuclease RecJ [Pseudomonadota bacterium]